MDTMDKRTIPQLREMKEKGEKIACLTAYDYLTAHLLDKAGIDLILVGDSGAMVFAGHETTLPINMDQIIYHTQAVARGVKKSLLIADMPFLSYQVSTEEAVRNAGRCMKEANADGVKLEGSAPVLETVHRLVTIGIPVMGHIGLTPQSIRSLGGYPLRGKRPEEAEALKQEARALEEAGAFSIVLEKIPADLAAEISKMLTIPTIGIGAGPQCDGQILVTHDMLGMFEAFKPKFVRRYAELGKSIEDAVRDYVRDVKTTEYPDKSESY